MTRQSVLHAGAAPVSYSRLNKSVDITEIRISKVAVALQCHFSRNQRQLQNEFDRSVEVDGVKNLVTVRL